MTEQPDSWLIDRMYNFRKWEGVRINPGALLWPADTGNTGGVGFEPGN